MRNADGSGTILNAEGQTLWHLNSISPDVPDSFVSQLVLGEEKSIPIKSRLWNYLASPVSEDRYTRIKYAVYDPDTQTVTSISKLEPRSSGHNAWPFEVFCLFAVIIMFLRGRVPIWNGPIMGPGDTDAAQFALCLFGGILIYPTVVDLYSRIDVSHFSIWETNPLSLIFVGGAILTSIIAAAGTEKIIYGTMFCFAGIIFLVSNCIVVATGFGVGCLVVYQIGLYFREFGSSEKENVSLE